MLFFVFMAVFFFGVAAYLNLWVDSLLSLGIGFVALGMGWNFLYVMTTEMILKLSNWGENKQVQGIYEACVWTGNLAASLVGGGLLVWLGWTDVNIMVIWMSMVYVCVLLVLVWRTDLYDWCQ